MSASIHHGKVSRVLFRVSSRYGPRVESNLAAFTKAAISLAQVSNLHLNHGGFNKRPTQMSGQSLHPIKWAKGLASADAKWQ